MESRPGKRIQVKPVNPPGRQRKKTRDDLVMERLATLCYYYPQYTLKDAAHLPINQVSLLLRIARRIKAEEYLHLVQIAVAPHSQKGKLVEKLASNYKKTIEES